MERLQSQDRPRHAGHRAPGGPRARRADPRRVGHRRRGVCAGLPPDPQAGWAPGRRRARAGGGGAGYSRPARVRGAERAVDVNVPDLLPDRPQTRSLVSPVASALRAHGRRRAAGAIRRAGSGRRPPRPALSAPRGCTQRCRCCRPSAVPSWFFTTSRAARSKRLPPSWTRTPGRFDHAFGTAGRLSRRF